MCYQVLLASVVSDVKQKFQKSTWQEDRFFYNKVHGKDLFARLTVRHTFKSVRFK